MAEIDHVNNDTNNDDDTEPVVLANFRGTYLTDFKQRRIELGFH